MENDRGFEPWGLIGKLELLWNAWETIGIWPHIDVFWAGIHVKCIENDRGFSNNGDACEQDFVRNMWKTIGVWLRWNLPEDASILECMENDRGFNPYKNGKSVLQSLFPGSEHSQML